MLLAEYEHLLSIDPARAERLKQVFAETHRFESLGEFLEDARRAGRPPASVRKSVILTYSKLSSRLEKSRVLMVSEVQKRGSGFFRQNFEAFIRKEETDLVVYFDTADPERHFGYLMQELDNLIQDFSDQLAGGRPKHVILVCRKGQGEGGGEVNYTEAGWGFQVIEDLSGSPYSENVRTLGKPVDEILEIVGTSDRQFARDLIRSCLENIDFQRQARELAQKFLAPSVHANRKECFLMQVLFEVYDRLSRDTQQDAFSDWKKEFMAGESLSIRGTIIDILERTLKSRLQSAVLRMKKEQLCVGLIMTDHMPGHMSAQFRRVFDLNREILFGSLR